MNAWQIAYDIGINLFSDVVFVFGLLFVLWVLHRRQLLEAKRFFGLHQQNEIRVFISGHAHAETVTKKVVTALEYEAAAELKDALRHLSSRGLLPKIAKVIAGLIGQTPQFIEAVIEVSPLEHVRDLPHSGSLILVGGPLRNQLTKCVIEAGSLLKYDTTRGRFVESVDGQYREVADSNNVAVLEKMKVNGRVIILAYGTGEKDTSIAVHHLIENWKRLDKEHLDRAFGIRLSIDSIGKAKVERVITG